ncbi:acyltransferase family protein [Chitinophaga sp. 30R24]|uniref:acyltransferase family protein n=1 Tax=Chitinophaga sp. 30R24 TaxID=3248838 RepID=UPI003B915C7E
MKPIPERTQWVDNLRSCITILVVAHHSALSYTTFAWFDPKRYINSTHPVVDTQRWKGLDLFVDFNDIFFMSLMFFIGGLFIVKSIRKKGKRAFLKERFFRLFIPFAVGCTCLMLIAYYPAYYLATKQTGIIGFVVDYFTAQGWPVGPPWFIWVLFLFNFLALLYVEVIERRIPWLRQVLVKGSAKPLAVFGVLWLLTLLLHAPVSAWVGIGTWTGIGPFDFQIGRILLYFGYFNIGVCVGATNFNTGIFSQEGLLIKRWIGWSLAMVLVYATLVLASVVLTQWVKQQLMPAAIGWSLYFICFAASCACSSLAFISMFCAIGNASGKWSRSLSENAYCIYLVHYIFVTWSQFALLPIALPAGIKFLFTFGVALGGSWWLSSWLRKYKMISRYV